MLSRRSAVIAAAVSSLLSSSLLAQAIPAFSGADGAARNVTGGRGGLVYHVTKLDQNYSDAGPGTLRYGLTDSNFGGAARTIVFDVAGTFWLGRFGADKGHDNGWDTASRINLGSNVTIAGQTAPGPVYIMGGVVKATGTNTILRNVTIAPGYGMRNFAKPEDGIFPTPGDFPDSYVYDALDISGTNQMFDHITTLYATDETISCNELANNLTIQYSNISQGQNYPQADAEASGVTYTGHALGSLLQAGTNANISVHHNLYAHQKGRLPRVGSEVGTGAYNDFRNNVFYNWLGTGGSGASGQPSYSNFVGNFWLAGNGGDDVSQTNGPDGIRGTADDVGIVVQAAGGTGIFSGSNSSGTRIFHSGNLRDTNKDGDALDTSALTNSNFGSATFGASAYWSPTGATYTGVTDSATVAYDRVLNYMGANWWTRDNVIDTPDERIIHEVRTGTGKIKAWADDPFNADPAEGVEWRTMLSYRANPTTGAAPFNRAAGFDTDQDGMPNAWETKHGLNPNLADNNGDFDADGYTNLEEYINELAEWPAPTPASFDGTTNNRYAQITNWDIKWQPSRYDVAKINTGTVIVDAVGQHAGTLLVGVDAGASGHLSAIAGWIEADVIRVGSASGSVGMITLGTNGLGGAGSVRVGSLLRVGNTGAMNFAGGKLELADAAIFDYLAGETSPLGDLSVEIRNGQGVGPGAVAGIVVASGLAHPGLAVGIAEAGQLNLTSFAGESVDSTTVLLAVTFKGDTNLDLKVDFDDLLALAQNYGSNSGWTGGDFDYSGSVDFDDLLALAQNYLAGTGLTLAEGQFESDLALAFSIVPEPSSIAGVVASMLFARRGRSN